MWSLSSACHRSSGRIQPAKILYQYDGPLIFTASFGYVDAFFLKFDELDETDLYVAAQTDQTIIDSIEAGQLSVRSALNRDFYWIVEVNKDLSFQRYWVCAHADFPEMLLPQKNVALHARHGLAPDSIDQLSAFFSVDYQGLGLKTQNMPFSLFKQLIDNTHEAARNILSPILLLGSKTATFDFDITEPIFGGLIISIQNPTVNRMNVEKKFRGKDIDIAVVQGQFSLQRDVFFEEMEEIVSQAERGSINESLVGERFSLLDRIQTIIPTEENQLKSVVFGANQGTKFAHVLVTEKAGGVINRAFQAAESRPVEEVGTVVVTNDPSRSFVLQSSRGKQVTCYVSFDNYGALRSNSLFGNGVALKAKGRLTRRLRRDILHVDGLPVIIQ